MDVVIFFIQMDSETNNPHYQLPSFNSQPHISLFQSDHMLYHLQLCNEVLQIPVVSKHNQLSFLMVIQLSLVVLLILARLIHISDVSLVPGGPGRSSMASRGPLASSPHITHPPIG